jgi:hypothetical protein
LKYWRGYLVAAIIAAITWALTQFAQAHSVLVDMIYPYVTRMIITSMSQWTGAMEFCLWQVLLIGLVLAIVASIVLMIVLRWNPIQWLGWVLAAVSCIVFLQTAIYGLNQYASPLADDVRLEIMDYTVSELNEATVYFRDKANALATEVTRDSEGKPAFGSFEELAQKAGDGFEVLTYQEAISVFAGSTVPVKKLGWSGLYTVRGVSGVTVPLTGEAAVNPSVPSAGMPFAMCKEMAYRMSIYSEADANFAAFLAGIYNPDPAFQYSAYLMAYRYCYEALSSVPTSTAQTCAAQTDAGVNQQLRGDLEQCAKFFGKDKSSSNVQDTTETQADRELDAQVELIEFSRYSDVSDLLTSWHIQNFVLPLHVEEEQPFDPKDPTQVDLTGIVNAKPAS